MASYFTSDTHAWHNNIMKYCRRHEYMTPEEVRLSNSGADFRVSDESARRMTVELARKINERVGSNATLYHMGDWGMRPKKSPGSYDRFVAQAREFRDMIKCKNVHLIAGNHDFDPEQTNQHARRFADLFSTFKKVDEINVDGVRIKMNHYAEVTWDGKFRCTWQNPSIMLYGHVHTRKDQVQRCFVSSEFFPALDVGVDGHDGYPWSLDEIMQTLKPIITDPNRKPEFINE